MASYTYKIITGIPGMRGGHPTDWSEVEKELNGLAADGWEVVSSDAVRYGSNASVLMGTGALSPAVTLVLRRASLETER